MSSRRMSHIFWSVGESCGSPCSCLLRRPGVSWVVFLLASLGMLRLLWSLLEVLCPAWSLLNLPRSFRRRQRAFMWLLEAPGPQRVKLCLLRPSRDSCGLMAIWGDLRLSGSSEPSGDLMWLLGALLELPGATCGLRGASLYIGKWVLSKLPIAPRGQLLVIYARSKTRFGHEWRANGGTHSLAELAHTSVRDIVPSELWLSIIQCEVPCSVRASHRLPLNGESVHAYTCIIVTRTFDRMILKPWCVSRVCNSTYCDGLG